MEEKHFDQLARAAAGGLPRRNVFKLLAAGVLGGLASRFSGQTTATAQPACGEDVHLCIQAAREALEDALRNTCHMLFEDCESDPNADVRACAAALIVCEQWYISAFQEEVKRCRDQARVCCPIGQEACGGDCCDPNLCETCHDGVCVSTCNAANCEVCQGGACGSTCNLSACEECQGGTCGSFCTGCQECSGGTWPICIDASSIRCPDSCQPCDPATGSCVPVQCPPGKQCVDGSCQCQVSCPPPKSPNPETCACECPEATCPPGQTQNPETCACECPATDCPPGQTLDPTTCQCVCGGVSCDDTCCDGTCTDTQTDPNNCGACGTVCPDDQTCEAGACGCGSASCPHTCCDGTCTDTTSDNNNCGTCGNVCAGLVCINGKCCQSDAVACGTQHCCNPGTNCDRGRCCPDGTAACGALKCCHPDKIRQMDGGGECCLTVNSAGQQHCVSCEVV